MLRAIVFGGPNSPASTAKPNGPAVPEVLGLTALKSGSYNNPGYLRLGFSWTGGLSPETRTEMCRQERDEPGQRCRLGSFCRGCGYRSARSATWRRYSRISSASRRSTSSSARVGRRALGVDRTVFGAQDSAAHAGDTATGSGGGR